MQKDRSFLDNYKYVFDPDGVYGASQNKPDLDPLKYAGIVRKYHPEFTDEQIMKLIHKARTEGCGYAACVNTVFLRFYGEEEKYREHFGFPMFTDDGKLNFEELFVDFYCATDNHIPYLWFDCIDHHEDDNFENGYGTTDSSREWRFETYMKKHGVPVNVVQISAGPKNILWRLSLSPVIVSVRPNILYDADGKQVFSSENGHSMSVTGVGANDLIRVSSWGREYYIRHGSYERYETYQQVFYKK